MKYSLLDLQNKPELILQLPEKQFHKAWREAVKLHGELEVLCAKFEAEFVRRFTVSKGKPGGFGNLGNV